MTSQSPQSKVDICNMALDHCGDTPITSIDNPQNPKEAKLARWYDATREALLRDYVWTFCQNYTVLARTGDGIGEWADAYTLPVDCIRVNNIGISQHRPVTCFELMARVLYVNHNTGLHLRYNRNETNVQLFDPSFKKLLALNLALQISYSITKKKSVVDQISQLITLAEPKASSVNSQEHPIIRVQRSKYMDARRTGTNNQIGLPWIDFGP